MSEQQQCPHCGAKSCFKNVPNSGFFGCGSTDLHGRFFQSKDCLRNQLRAADRLLKIHKRALELACEDKEEGNLLIMGWVEVARQEVDGK